jgi:hypothetical protein
MPRSLSQNLDDPFDGLLLPTSAWKALEDAKISTLEHLKTIASQLEQIRLPGSSKTDLRAWLPGEPCGSG